jgi:hypothetical protein
MPEFSQTGMGVRSIGFTAAAVVLLLLTHYFMAPFTYLAVQKACSEDGGVRILKTDDVAGYWHGGYRFKDDVDWADCTLCADQVARGTFEFVDFERTSAMDKGPPGLVRFQLAAADDPNCDHSVLYQKPPAGKCVAITRLDEQFAARYRYRNELIERRGWLGVKIRDRRATIYDRNSDEQVASLTFYDAGTPAEQSGDFARSYHCQNMSMNPLDEDGFLRAVLRVADRTPINNSRTTP